MIEIVVDSRELRSPILGYLQALPDVNCTVKELVCGDYLPHSTHAVERKEATDFVLSIMDRRLFSQVLRLKDEFESVTFLIEGDIYKTRSAITPEALTGALSYLMTLAQVSVVMVKTPKESADLIFTMARHLQVGLGYEIALRANKPKNLTDLAQFAIEGLPGIGPKSAQALLKHFGSVAAVYRASVSELQAVPGVGKKTAERVREVIEFST